MKFRVWDLKNKKMLTPNKNHSAFLINEHGGLYKNNALSSSWYNDFVFTGERQNDYKIMPSTGIKDDNNVNIYEGDWVQVKDNEDQFTGLWLVRSIPYFLMRLALACDAIMEEEDDDCIAQTYFNIAGLNVIGNIYEKK